MPIVCHSRSGTPEDVRVDHRDQVGPGQVGVDLADDEPEQQDRERAHEPAPRRPPGARADVPAQAARDLPDGAQAARRRGRGRGADHRPAPPPIARTPCRHVSPTASPATHAVESASGASRLRSDAEPRPRSIAVDEPLRRRGRALRLHAPGIGPQPVREQRHRHARPPAAPRRSRAARRPATRDRRPPPRAWPARRRTRGPRAPRPASPPRSGRSRARPRASAAPREAIGKARPADPPAPR